MAVVGARLQLESQIQKINTWTSSIERITKHNPVFLPAIKTARVGKRTTVPTCTLQINRPSNELKARNRNTNTSTTTEPALVVPGEAPTSIKGWTDAMGMRDPRLVAQLNALAVLASDRTEMHTALATQRDNWNHLFHTTITTASLTAAAAAAMNGAEQALGLSVLATALGLGVTAFMGLVNKLQPSQLADEQRHAARFFKRLTADIEATLETDPCCCEDASSYWENKIGTLHALDTAFPLPLTPGGLEKFPQVVRPSILSGPPADLTMASVKTSPLNRFSTNGWTTAAEEELKRASQLLHTSDIPTYVDMAKSVNHLNKILALASPALAFSGALCSMVDAVAGASHLSILGAVCTVAAVFVHSLSHAVQLGAAYETYRNCAGYYVDVERSIERTLRLPVQQREDGVVFLGKIAMMLGRSPAQSPFIPSDQRKAGTLF